MFRKLSVVFCAAVLGLSSRTVDAASLWATDSGTGSSSTIYELDAATGAVLSSLPGPGTFADALSFANDGQSIFILDSSNNSDVYQIDLGGNILNAFSVSLDAEGLTILADNSLVIGGGVSNTVAFVNPANGAIISQFAPVFQIFGLSSDGAGLLYGLRIDGIIDTYDLAGNLLDSLDTDATGITLGLAYDGTNFYISSTGSTIFYVDGSTGDILDSYNGPGPFTEGLDFPVGVQVPAVPEPSTLAILGIGLAGLAAGRRSRQS